MRKLNPVENNTPQEILAAARREFLEKGFRDARLENIREATSVKSIATICEYFGSKSDLFNRVIIDYAEEMENDIKGTRDVTQLFMALNRFFYECKIMGCPSNLTTDEFNRGVVTYIANTTEKAFRKLLPETDWIAATMAAGAVERTALCIINHNREHPLGMPIYNLTVDLAERVMKVCSYPSDVRLRILERLQKQAAEMLEKNRMYPDKCTGKKYTVERLAKGLRKLSLTADIVRVVDPGPCRVLVLHDDGRVTESSRCHGFWYRDDRCGDCVSKDCVRDNQYHEKEEKFDGYLFNVISVPIRLERDDGTVMKCAIEYIKARKVAPMVQ